MFALCLPAAAAPIFRPSPLPMDLPTLHFILAPTHPAVIAASFLNTLPSAKPVLPAPVIFPLTPPAAATALPAVALPLPDVAPLPLPLAGERGGRELRLPVRAALEDVGAQLAVVEPGSVGAGRSLDSLYEAGRHSAEAPVVQARRLSDAALLDAALAEARKSATGRRVLARAEKAFGGKPMAVQVRDLGRNLGEYDYMAGVLRMDRAHLEADPKQAAATLVHELTHVLQHREGVPAEALELELEAHIVSMAVSRELGIPLNGFEAAAAQALKRGPKAYADWMAGQLPGKVRLLDSTLDAAFDHLETEVDDLENADRVSAERLDWARRDLALLKSPKGRAAYRAFADRVLRLIRRSRGTV